jgi:Ca2+-dependent lipid-binding protein
LTNIIPLIGAAQVSFINPPTLKLNFTGAADVADFSLIDGAVRKVILNVIKGIVVLPNRISVKLDANNDYFKTYHQPLGIIRITVEKAWGFAEESKTKAKRLLSKLTRASPDCYAAVEVGAEEAWRTSTKNNTTTPVWGETHDFIVTDFDQCITVNVMDHDVNSDDEVGLAVTTVKEMLTTGSAQELGLIHNGEDTGGIVAIKSHFYHFEADGSSFSASDHKSDGLLCGLVSILVAGATGIKGQREELSPSVVVTWGEKHRFQTAIKTDAPGTDINNPTFDQNFRIPVTSDMVGSSASSFRISCFNKDVEVGGTDVPFSALMEAPDMILQDSFDIGGGAKVRASICLRGINFASGQDMSLPRRGR